MWVLNKTKESTIIYKKLNYNKNLERSSPLVLKMELLGTSAGRPLTVGPSRRTRPPKDVALLALTLMLLLLLVLRLSSLMLLQL